MRWICRGHAGPATVDTTRGEADAALAHAGVAAWARGQPETTNFEPAGEGATAATAATVAAGLHVTPSQSEAGVEDDSNWL